MKSPEALKNINYKDVTYVLCGTFSADVYRDIFTGGVNLVNLHSRRIIRSDTSYCSMSAIGLDYLLPRLLF